MVLWHDAFSSLEEFTEEDILQSHKPAMIHTHGYILVSNEVGVWIASEWLPGDPGKPDTWRGHHFIPRGMVVKEATRRKRAKKPLQEGGPLADT